MNRIVWIDSARGLTIILVVLFHAMRMIGDAEVVQPLVQLNYLLGAIRLPAFFLISGILTSFGVRRNWRTYFNRRLWPMIWVFVIWGAVLIALSQVLPWPNEVLPVSYMWGMWTHPFVHMWFLRDLIVLAVIARLAVQVPTPLLLGLAAAYHLVAHFNDGLPLSLAIWFLAGVRLPDLFMRLPERYRMAKLVVAGFCCLLVAILFGIETAKPLIAISGVCTILCFSALIVDVPMIGAILHHAGRHSLPIYLMHMIVMGGLIVLPLRALPYAQWWLPFALAAAGIAGSLLCHWLLRILGMGWLFTLPLPEMARKPKARQPLAQEGDCVAVRSKG